MIEYDVLSRAVGALLAGGCIGLERSYHGRAAGVRTYALVCFASALLVAAVGHPQSGTQSAQSADVSRVIQGIMTGIGFLGAGVIVKEGFTVRGLTTAASIWVTAAVGVLMGLGHYLPVAVATVLTLGMLSVFRSVEERMPSQSYLHCHVCFRRDSAMVEQGIRQLTERHGFHITELSYKLDASSGMFEYRMVLWSADPLAAGRFAQALKALPSIEAFKLSPSRD
jgi:putative Mg2+ transporter-C (MgtC) family protein